MASGHRALSPVHLLFLLLFMSSIFIGSSSSPVGFMVGSGPAPEVPMSPMSAGMSLQSVLIKATQRRRLNRFQVCAICTCCGGPRGLCIPSPCCYAINCNIPNRPFGFCSFTPKTCNCFGCRL